MKVYCPSKGSVPSRLGMSYLAIDSFWSGIRSDALRRSAAPDRAAAAQVIRHPSKITSMLPDCSFQAVEKSIYGLDDLVLANHTIKKPAFRWLQRQNATSSFRLFS
jgi:hypothetical protein